jgi:hypothetical protein
MDWLGANENRIKSVEAPRGEFAIEDLQIAMPSGCAMTKNIVLKRTLRCSAGVSPAVASG